jgi:STE24 endopeptidase
VNIIFYLILGILIISFILERILDALNIKYIKPGLPSILKGRYNEEEYSRSQVYEREKSRFGLISSTYSFIIIISFLVLGGFGWLNDIVLSISGSAILQALLFFGIIGFAFDILGIPFEIYATFVIEEKYGFNKTTPRTYVLDKIKSWLLTAIIGGGLLALIVWFYQLTGSFFWIIAWAAISLFTIFMSMFYSDLIVPLFNKQSPLREGEVKTLIEDFAGKNGFSLKGLYEIDGSKRSTKSNAYFTGLGRKKRIVLYDTLINDLSPKEILAVLAHEIGHYKRKHLIIATAIGIIQTGVLLFILSFFLESSIFAEALGADEPAFHLSVIVFGILYSPISMILGLLFNHLSRRNEYQADEYAAERELGPDLGNALISMSEKHLSNLTPHPFFVFVNYSHPTLLQRLDKLGFK